jgi:hypothetical protein
MVRSQDCLYPPPLPPSPLSLSAHSVNSVLRKTRSLTQIDPSTPLRSPRYSPHAAIPFRITFFAHPHHLTPIESHSCKKQGRGWGVRCLHSTQTLPSISTQSKHPTHSNTRIFIIFSHLLHIPLDPGGGTHHSLLRPSTFIDLRLRGHWPRNTGHVLSARLRELSASALSFSLLFLSTFNCRLSTFLLPRTSTLPPVNYGIIPPHRGSTRNPIRKRGGFSD